MKPFITLIALLVSLVQALAQGPTSAELALYPLNVGDRWQYRFHIVGYYRDTSSTYVETSVVADTLRASGKRYKTLRELPSGILSFMRVDSATGNVYQYQGNDGESLIDSLRANLGDQIPAALLWCSGVDTVDVLGSSIKRKMFSGLLGVPWQWRHSLGQGLGIIQRAKAEDNPYYPLLDQYLYDLVYAKVANREYGALVAVRENAPTLPLTTELSQNYPNPFNPTTTIRYAVRARAHVLLVVFNTLGQDIAELFDGEADAGIYEVKFDARALPSGMYFYRMRTGNFVQTKTMLVVR